MVGFNSYDLARVEAGEIEVTWRLWKYSHVTAGKVYALDSGLLREGSPRGALAVDDVRAVRVADITDVDAHEAGLSSARDLIDQARSHTRAEVDPETVLYRVKFHYLPQAPEKPRLALPEIRKRLERLDGSTGYGAWTEAALRLIEANPQVVARELAAEMDMPTQPFKVNIRKLKALGLTISHEIGYELSELGQAYLDSLGAADSP